MAQAPSPSSLARAYGQLPLTFEANVGQTDPQVDFLSRGNGYTLFLTPDEAVLSLAAGDANDVVRMRIVGANPTAQPAGWEEQAGRTNYLLGDDLSQWHTGVANYGRVEYQDVYSGIDLVYYGNQRRLEYDFVVAPGANPDLIRLSFDGVQRMELDASGNLILHTPGGDLVKEAPVIYQEIDGAREAVSGRYVVEGSQVRFEVGAYDATLPLVVDPILSYSTYLGGSGLDIGTAITVDGAGNVYVTGSTSSRNFPTKSPVQRGRAGGEDAFITKLNATGSALVFSTYLGGSVNDGGFGIALDGSGNVYMTGFTDSSNFPTTAGGFDRTYNGLGDAFVAKLNASGSALLYSTFLGGSGGENGSTGGRTGSIAVDALGMAYVTGRTSSTNFPTTAGALQTVHGAGSDAFVAKLDPGQSGAASLVYSTYLGGSDYDEGEGIAVDGSGQAHVSGRTGSANYPTVNAFQPALGSLSERDAFVAKLSANGSSLLYSTYLGGSGYEEAGTLALDGSGNVYLTGATDSTTDFPTFNAIGGI